MACAGGLREEHNSKNCQSASATGGVPIPIGASIINVLLLYNCRCGGGPESPRFGRGRRKRHLRGLNPCCRLVGPLRQPHFQPVVGAMRYTGSTEWGPRCHEAGTVPDGPLPGPADDGVLA